MISTIIITSRVERRHQKPLAESITTVRARGKGPVDVALGLRGYGMVVNVVDGY